MQEQYDNSDIINDYLVVIIPDAMSKEMYCECKDHVEFYADGYEVKIFFSGKCVLKLIEEDICILEEDMSLCKEAIEAMNFFNS